MINRLFQAALVIHITALHERYAVAVRLLRLTITVSGRTPIARGKHPVQRADSNRDLGRSTPIGPES